MSRKAKNKQYTKTLMSDTLVIFFIRLKTFVFFILFYGEALFSLVVTAALGQLIILTVGEAATGC